MSQTNDLAKVDFGEHAASPATPDKLEQLSDLVLQLEDAERAQLEAEAVLAQRKARLKGIIEHELPELMLELRQPILHTSDGRKVKITDVVRGTLPAANRPKGHHWLMNNGHAGLVKRTVEIAFAAVEGEKAKELLGSMEEQFGGNARQILKVEASTMTSFVKKQLVREADENFKGIKMPRDIFEIKEFKHAKISKK